MDKNEQNKKETAYLIKLMIGLGMLSYVVNKYKIVKREEFNAVCGLLANLQNRGYIRIIDNKFIQIVEGLLPPPV